MPHWKRNLIVLCFVQLVTMIGFSAFQPFVAYYLLDLGIETPTEAATWSAVFNSGAAISMMIASPIWGSLADRHGRRMMLIRATTAGCIFTLFMGLAQTPTQLVAARIIQGLFSGTVVAAITLVATETPEQYLGRSLGLMQTAQFVGQTIGPLVGGVAADAFGYRNVFFVSSSLMLASVVTTLLFVRETKRPRPEAAPASTKQEKRVRGGALAAIANRNTLVLVLTLTCNSFAIAVLSPILSLYIRALIGDAPNLATLAGTIMSVAAFTSSLSAVLLGHWADRFGQKKILLICVIGVALIHIPQALVTHPNQLIVLRAIQGLFMGGIMPTANALLARATDVSRRGAVYGFSNSAQAGGRALGPAVGAATANAWGMASAFLVTASVFGIMALLVGLFVRVAPTPEEKSETIPATG